MKSERWFRARAKGLYHSDGSIEVDRSARVSRGGDTGAYVEAWVWVPMESDAARQQVSEHSKALRKAKKALGPGCEEIPTKQAIAVSERMDK
jgi:hypothetical protein